MKNNIKFFISHRGNMSGPIYEDENKPEYIDNTIKEGYDVEIDVWVIEEELFLGHDEPQYKIETDWIINRLNKLWVHCKNVSAIEWFAKSKYNFNYFWHEKDTLTLTSKGYIWVYPGKQPVINSISVMPEIFDDKINLSIGVCSDYIKNYKIR
jgi:hypothetical protein